MTSFVESGVFQVGKYRGASVGDVAGQDVGYVHWLLASREQLALPVDAVEELQEALLDALLPDDEDGSAEDCDVLPQSLPPQVETAFSPRDPFEEWMQWPAVWTEDDATPGTPGHVTLADAWKRRYGEDLSTQRAIRVFDDCDARYYLMPGNRAYVSSYPGNSQILERPVAVALPPIPPPPPVPPIPAIPPIPRIPLSALLKRDRIEEEEEILGETEALPSIVWTDEQKAALDEISDWYEGRRGGFYSLTGPAGTGKSTLLREIARRYPSATLAAMTGKAALRLSDCTGRGDTSTLHRILYWPPKPGEEMRFTRLRDAPYGLVVVDESSMMTPSVFADLQKWEAEGTRFLLVGDAYQLPPVITGDELKKHGEDYSVFSVVRGSALQTVMRSVGGVLRAASRVRETGEICRQSDEEYEFSRTDTPLQDAVRAYIDDPTDHLLITWKNAARMQANRLVRELTGHDGELPDVGEPVLLKKNGQDFLNGEVVECGGFEDGPVVGKLRCLWMRVGANGSRILVTVQGGPKDKGGEFFDGGTPWIENWKAYHIDLQKQVLPEPIPVTWGYCLTAHSAQGSEARRVTVFLERGDERSRNFRKETTLPDNSRVSFAARWVYTATTRGKQRSTMILGK